MPSGINWGGTPLTSLGGSGGLGSLSSWGQSFGGGTSGGGLGSLSNWSSAFTGSGSSGSSWLSKLGGLFGGGSGSQSSGLSTNIFASMLGGLAGSSDAKLALEMARETALITGSENRKTASFEADLMDYYTQKNKVRKRAALDTYGQFSLLDRYAPGATAAPPIDINPNRPTP